MRKNPSSMGMLKVPAVATCDDDTYIYIIRNNHLNPVKSFYPCSQGSHLVRRLRCVQIFLADTQNQQLLLLLLLFLHSAYWLPTRKSYFTRWPIPLVVCSTWKKEKKKKSGSAPPHPPPRPRCSSIGINKIKIT